MIYSDFRYFGQKVNLVTNADTNQLNFYSLKLKTAGNGSSLIP